MLIKGLQKTSLIDFPPYLASVIFTGGCSFRCGFCHNPDLVLHFDKLKTISEEEVFEYLEEKKNWIDGVVITGGEPTLQKDLVEFMSRIKSMGLLLKLDTNGSNPDMLKEIIDKKIVDYIAMDVKTRLEDYEKVVGVKVDVDKIKRSILLIRDSGIDYEFRTTVIPGIIGKEEVASIGELLKGSKKYVLQNFRNSAGLIDEKFKEINPYSEKELEELKNVVADKFETVEIRK